MPSSPAAAHHRPHSLGELFLTFTVLALQGFGGVLAVAQRELVERKRWLSREEFLDTYSFSQLLPGPNVVNMALMLGDRFFGWRGALTALAGMMAAPLLIVLVLAASYGRFAEHEMVAGALRGMGAVAAGLMVAMAVRLAASLRSNPAGMVACAALVVATVVAMAVLRLPLLWILGGLGGLGWALAHWQLRRAERQR